MIENLDSFGILIGSVLIASMPLLLAALGELITEKSGVLNLGVEGMMLIGAISAFAVSHTFGNNFLGVMAGMLGAVAVSLIFSFLTQILMTNHVATGLALTIFCTGLSAMLGKPFVGIGIERIGKWEIPLLSDIPLIGPMLFQNDPIIYFALALTAATSYFLFKTKAGLILRAIGDNHNVAHAVGYNVKLIRFCAISYGAMMAGMSGAYISLIYTPQWTEGMTAGRGWIALALVVFSSWRPARLFLGANIFGLILIAQLYLQALGVPISSQIMSMAPYIATIVVLVIISKNRYALQLNVPKCLGKIFHA